MKTNQNLVNNFRSNLTSHLVGAKSSKITVAKYIVYTLVTSQSARNSREVAKVLRVDRRNIKSIVERNNC
jgi:transcription initiation factor TFIIIB Brf1 subunit/transcription initiation factor TFIIB